MTPKQAEAVRALWDALSEILEADHLTANWRAPGVAAVHAANKADLADLIRRSQQLAVRWDRVKVGKLRRQYNAAVKQGKTEFNFKDREMGLSHPVTTNYAKRLLETLHQEYR